MHERTVTLPQPAHGQGNGQPALPMDVAGRAKDHPWIHPVAAFQDNYIWIITPGPAAADARGPAIVVDPGDAAPVNAWLDARDLKLSAILITHHHPDHVGGVAALRQRHPGVVVHGPADGPFKDIDVPHRDGESFRIDGIDARAHVIGVPGHTLDHVAYRFDALGPLAGEPVLFCGDTLFAGGCGRLFEGTADQMHRSLASLAALPGNTRVYCAHEYTLSNLAFARAAAPDDAAVAGRAEAARVLRDRDTPTVPSRLDAEQATNPFVRASTAARLAELRTWKDGFRG